MKSILEAEEDEELDEEDGEFEKWEWQFQKLAFHQNGLQVLVVTENEILKVRSFVIVVGGGDDWCCLSSICCLHICSFI